MTLCLGSEVGALPAPTPGTYSSWLSLSEGLLLEGKMRGALCAALGMGGGGVGRPVREWGFLVLRAARGLSVTPAHTSRNEQFLKFYLFPDYPLLK